MLSERTALTNNAIILSPSMSSFSFGSGEHTQALIVPPVANKAAGGWYDRDNWLAKIVFEKTADKSIEELLKLVYYREERSPYGEDHTSTKSKKGGQHDPSPRKMAAKTSHQYQEQDRRFRHRALQAENDMCAGTFIAELAEQNLPWIKETINAFPREEPVEADRKLKRLGKDEQLAAAALTPHLMTVLICRLCEALSKVEDQHTMLKRDYYHATEELSRLGPQRTVNCLKRTAAALDDDYLSDNHCTSRGPQRPRVDDMGYTPDHTSRYRFPLSPRSEEGEYTSSFSSR